MSDFFPIKKNALNRDINLIKKLEIQHRQLEERMFNTKNAEEAKKFESHPKRFYSDLDTTATPKVLYNYSSSTSKLFYRPTGYQERKLKTQSIHKKLHEKLSIIDSHSFEKSESSDIGDQLRNLNHQSEDRFQTLPGYDFYDRDSIESSIDYETEFEVPSIKSNEKKRGDVESRAGKTCSAASKATSGARGRRKSAGSKVSLHSAKGVAVPEFEKKFKVLVERSLHSIIDIRSILTKGIPPPDGDENEARRLIRVKEFSNRFSRNYLYPLARQLKELSVVQQPNPLVLNQKLLSIYQIVNTGLQAYQNHLPSSVGDYTFNQLKILMSNIAELCGLHRRHVKDEEESYVVEFIDTFKINAELVTQKVEELLLKPPAPTDTVLKSENSKISLSKYGEGKKKTSGEKVPGEKKGQTDKRFAMYTVTASFRKDPYWKKTVESLAKKRFNVKSKYKTATFKHRPPVEKEPDKLSYCKLKTLFPKKSEVLRPTRLNTPVNEDCIKTMVEAQQNVNNHLEKEEWERMEKRKKEGENNDQENREEILMKLLQLALKKHKETLKEDDQAQISEILTLVKQHPDTEFLNKVLEEINGKSGGKTNEDDQKEHNKENQDNQMLTLEIVQSQFDMLTCDGSGRTKPKRKEPKITISGDKNARLICITDDNSVIIEPAQRNENNDKGCRTENSESAKIGDDKSKERTTETLAKGTQKGKNSAFAKIGRIKKGAKSLKPLDKKQAVDAIQYKLDFYRHCKNNPMYKRSTTCQPWVLMGKISEELLNQCLLAVAREIEVNDIVERVYESELQL